MEPQCQPVYVVSNPQPQPQQMVYNQPQQMVYVQQQPNQMAYWPPAPNYYVTGQAQPGVMPNVLPTPPPPEQYPQYQPQQPPKCEEQVPRGIPVSDPEQNQRRSSPRNVEYGAEMQLAHAGVINSHVPTMIRCPACNYYGSSVVEYVASGSTYFAMVILCCVFWPCVCLPLLIDDCKDGVHICPNCRRLIGVSKPCT